MTVKPAEYRLAPEAEGDIEAIWLYSLKGWGLEQANRYTDELTDAFARPAVNPKMATPCDHIRKGYRRSRVRRHAIYIQQTDYGITVIRVLHDRLLSTGHL